MAKRLQKERASFEKDPLKFVGDIDFVNDDVFNWRVKLKGPSGTPYSGGTFEVSIACPDTYPFKPPKVGFVTKVYHPSVEKKTGNVCADIIGQGWGPTLNIRHVLTVLYEMLESPSPDHPLEEAIAQLLREKPRDFEKKAKKYTKEYAK